ncbi:hypothetical protein R6Z07F_008725 [Ovis aries]|uniref:ADAM metallopeptidase domain 20 n=6 Tax=Ovis aries TaxID=9940 RepID=A0AC11EG37_SHEEP|nr:disintegrin and metalloproteinase domain-containing protein 20 [Ovis aries]
MTVGEALVHFRVTPLLLWFGVCLFISGHCQARPSQHFSSPELVIPLKVTGWGRNAKVPGWLSYSLRFGGQRHITHMKVKKLLISRPLPVFTYTDQRSLHQDQPYLPDDCYYHGYVEGVPKSLVALSTCSGGFRGVLQINDLAYEIEPVRSSATFEHWVYRIDSDDTQFPRKRCGLTEEEIARQLELHNFTLKQSSYTGWWTHLLFLELVVVVDNLRFVHSGSNVSVVQIEIATVVNVINSLYHPLEVDVTLTGLEIWTEGNQIATENMDTMLEDFAVWKFFNLDNRLPHDAAHLFIKKSFGIQLGLAYVDGVCQNPLNCAIIVFEDDSLFDTGLIVTHELGHNLGMLHDTEFCVCEFEFCIMYPAKAVTSKFSNCSYGEFWNNVMRKGFCLISPPNPANIFRIEYCGNLVVEEGEECDCGTVQQCKRDHCCLPDCTLKPGAACAFGSCCKNCKVRSTGTLCRKQINACDLPEWCNGASHQCPEDVYVQDGIPCSDSAYCYKKNCVNHDEQCREIFGKDARSASRSCYKEINTQGNRFGHCGIRDIEYIKCEVPDILCGRVQCENVEVIPNLMEHSTVHQFQVNDTTCWGTDYHIGMSIPDVGQVKDGTMCGQKKICVHSRCVSMVPEPQACQPKTCHMKGVCNSKQECHCNPGWAPPYCKDKGSGGSNSSGPPGNPQGDEEEEADEDDEAEQSEETKMVKNSHMLLWLIPLICLFVCCFLVFCKKHKKEKPEMKTEEETEEEETEEEDMEEESD